jgi:hypothetical protein
VIPSSRPTCAPWPLLECCHAFLKAWLREPGSAEGPRFGPDSEDLAPDKRTSK